MVELAYEIIDIKHLSLLLIPRLLTSYINAAKILVVFIETNNFLNNVEVLSSLLSEIEKEHLYRIPIKEVRRKYAIHRGILRLCLSNITGRSPEVLSLNTAKYGKPYLSRNVNEMDLRFNLSHSSKYAIYAFSIGFEVGIDIEEAQCHLSVLDAASLVFAQSELTRLRLIPEHSQKSAFLKLWTKKEAFSKVLGDGLHMNFQELVLGIEMNIFQKKSMIHENLRLFDLSEPPLFFASLAAEMD